MLKHKLVIKMDWWSKTPFCLIKSYSLCGATPRTYRRGCQAGFGPRVIWIIHTFVSYITKLHGSIMKGKISTNQYMLSLKSWIKAPLTQMWVETWWGVPPSMSWMILHSRYGSSCLAVARKMVTTCVWLTSQIMERYSENLQVNSSRLHKLSLLWSR